MLRSVLPHEQEYYHELAVGADDGAFSLRLDEMSRMRLYQSRSPRAIVLREYCLEGLAD